MTKKVEESVLYAFKKGVEIYNTLNVLLTNSRNFTGRFIWERFSCLFLLFQSFNGCFLVNVS